MSCLHKTKKETNKKRGEGGEQKRKRQRKERKNRGETEAGGRGVCGLRKKKTRKGETETRLIRHRIQWVGDRRSSNRHIETCIFTAVMIKTLISNHLDFWLVVFHFLVNNLFGKFTRDVRILESLIRKSDENYVILLTC